MNTFIIIGIIAISTLANGIAVIVRKITETNEQKCNW